MDGWAGAKAGWRLGLEGWAGLDGGGKGGGLDKGGGKCWMVARRWDGAWMGGWMGGELEAWSWKVGMEGLDGGGEAGWRRLDGMEGGREKMDGGVGLGWRLGWRDWLGARAWMEEWRVLDGEEWRDGGG